MTLKDLPVGMTFKQESTIGDCDCEFQVAGEAKDPRYIPVDVVRLCWMHHHASFGSDGRGPWNPSFNSFTPVFVDYLALALEDTFAETLGG